MKKAVIKLSIAGYKIEVPTEHVRDTKDGPTCNLLPLYEVLARIMPITHELPNPNDPAWEG